MHENIFFSYLLLTFLNKNSNYKVSNNLTVNWDILTNVQILEENERYLLNLAPKLIQLEVKNEKENVKEVRRYGINGNYGFHVCSRMQRQRRCKKG